MNFNVKTDLTNWVLNEPEEPNLVIKVNGTEIYSGNRIFDKNLSTIIRYITWGTDSNGMSIKIEKYRDKSFLSWVRYNGKLTEIIHQAYPEIPWNELTSDVMLRLFNQINAIERKDYNTYGQKLHY